MSAKVSIWAAEPLQADVRLALERLAEAEDIAAIAVMPDVHLAHGVCVGTVSATTRLIYPAAVGGDIGCGMAAVAFDAAAGALDNARAAAAVLAGLYERIPFIKHAVAKAPQLPVELVAAKLSAPSLEKLKERDGRLQFDTLGRGNHFIELQRDQDDRLWLAVHSGSRAMGPAIRDHHLRGAAGDGELQWLDADSDRGGAYVADVAWARTYARASRRAMAESIAELIGDLFDSATDWSTYFDCDHNHVQRERHGDIDCWIHRKGALHAEEAMAGIIPGSMGSASYHVEGRGLPAALCSSSHGAGRALSRSDARRRIPASRLLGDAQGVWFDHRLGDRLREEAPAAYKDIGKVMRAQRELTRIVRRLRPLLVYKGA
jgi:tRNA-splicing ligase RtcB